jgi:hypothetical protein
MNAETVIPDCFAKYFEPGPFDLLATNKNDRWFFVYGFAKNERDNIENREVLALKRLAAKLLGMDANAINQLLADKELKEICKDEK